MKKFLTIFACIILCITVSLSTACTKKNDVIIPSIGANGNWWIDGEDTGIQAIGKDGMDGVDGKDGTNGVDGQDGLTPSIGANGNWWIDGEDTGIQAIGKDGTNGVDGKDGTNGVDGQNGHTPSIGANGNWWIDGEDTGIQAIGKDGTNGVDGKDGTNGIDGKDGINGIDGKDGLTPSIGSNGNWWIDGKDTGIQAIGKDGADGVDGKDGTNGVNGGAVVTPSIGSNGNWWIDGKDTGIQAIGKDGTNGVDGKDGRSILKVEIDDGCLWVTFSDDPENPINVGALNNTYDGTEGLDFYLLQDGTYGVEMGKTKYLGEIIIPSTYNGKAVTQILSYAFANSYATSITIPSSITKICKHAFDGAQITTLTIPASVLYVEEYVITSNNTALKNVTFEGDETIIANNWNSNWSAIYISPIEGGVIEHGHGCIYYNETLNFYANNHSGVCILADEGTNVITSFTGTVTEINIDDALIGPYIVVENENLKAVYHFVNAIEGLQVGDAVTAGQVLGTVCGAVGENHKMGPHIRFEMFDTENESGEIALNPKDYITFAKDSNEEA